LLRKRAAEVVGNRARLTMPPLELCTDNAAMIAAAAFFNPGPAGEGEARAIEVEPSLGWIG